MMEVPLIRPCRGRPECPRVYFSYRNTARALVSVAGAIAEFEKDNCHKLIFYRFNCCIRAHALAGDEATIMEPWGE